MTDIKARLVGAIEASQSAGFRAELLSDALAAIKALEQSVEIWRQHATVCGADLRAQLVQRDAEIARLQEVVDPFYRRALTPKESK